MNQVVMVPIPLSPEAAEALRGDPAKLSMVGGLVDDVLRASAPADPLLAMMEAVGRKAQAAGLTEADVDAELAAWNAERRSWYQHGCQRAAEAGFGAGAGCGAGLRAL